MLWRIFSKKGIYIQAIFDSRIPAEKISEFDSTGFRSAEDDKTEMDVSLSDKFYVTLG